MNDQDKRLASRIRMMMKQIREATPRREQPTWRRPSDLTIRDDYLHGERIGAASITLFPSGCQHAAGGGCSMCGEWSGSNLGQLVPPEFHVAQFAASVSDLFSDHEIQWLRIYQEGSFLNDREMTPEARAVILRLASNLGGIRRVTIESRPEYITDDVSAATRGFVKADVELLIGIGLEAKDSFTRNVCIGKGTSLSSYQRAVKAAHANGILTLAYVILKPPFLTEREALAQAAESVAYAFEIGFDEVYVQAASIHEWSLSELLALRGLYAPPWLWSVVEVIKSTVGLGVIKIGGLEYFPRPALVAQNYRDIGIGAACGCSRDVWRLIQEYNATGNIDMFATFECECHAAWQLLMESEEQEPLAPRVSRLLSSVSVEDYLHYKRQKAQSAS
jgi:radical SAM enzyme (TIGR01210 family)